MKRVDFSPRYLQDLMPSSQKKNSIQILKRFKNRAIQMCEEAAKQDRDHVAFALQRIELGMTLVPNLEEVAEGLAEWLARKGFRAEVDSDNPLLVHIEWGTEKDAEPQPSPELPRPVLRNQGQTPWFDWMQPQGKTPVSKHK